MKSNRKRLEGLGLTCLVLLFPVSIVADDGAEAKGSITVGGESVALDHILLDSDRSGPFLSVLVSDTPLPPPCEPLDVMTYAESKPISGVLFTITDELELAPSMNALYHPSLEAFDGYGAIGGPVDLQRADGVIRGTLRDTIAIDDREFEVDVDLAFDDSSGELSIAPRTIEGADSAPARAFVAMVDAIVAMDIDGMMAMSSPEMRAELEAAGDVDLELLVAFADFVLPKKMTILDTVIDGDTALLTATGESQVCMGTETSDGTIEMVRDGKAWKVVKVKWEG